MRWAQHDEIAVRVVQNIGSELKGMDEGRRWDGKREGVGGGGQQGYGVEQRDTDMREQRETMAG